MYLVMSAITFLLAFSACSVSDFVMNSFAPEQTDPMDELLDDIAELPTPTEESGGVLDTILDGIADLSSSGEATLEFIEVKKTRDNCVVELIEVCDVSIEATVEYSGLEDGNDNAIYCTGFNGELIFEKDLASGSGRVSFSESYPGITPDVFTSNVTLVQCGLTGAEGWIVGIVSTGEQVPWEGE
jgi:hypothetical protein